MVSNISSHHNSKKSKPVTHKSNHGPDYLSNLGLPICRCQVSIRDLLAYSKVP